MVKTMQNIITLSREEALQASTMGVKRRLTIVFKDIKSTHHNGSAINNNWWLNDIEAACAELAFAKFIGEDWVGSVNTFTAPDVGDSWQVRYTNMEDGCLIIRQKDKLNMKQKFVLVTGSIPCYTIKGYMNGEEAFKDEYIRNPNNSNPAWFIPQRCLYKF